MHETKHTRYYSFLAGVINLKLITGHGKKRRKNVLNAVSAMLP
jgi:hypothetical protein